MAGGNTDTRIVKLEFENRQFERNIAKSTKSVEELKEAMDFEETSKGLDNFAKSIGQLDFSRFEANLQKLTDKFTGLGNIGEYVLSRIRNTLESAARDIEYFIRDMSVGQVSIGQSKYDEMNKAVMTIVSSEKASEEQAYNTMERIMAYTDQTSHSFNTMVGMLANLTSIGYGLDDAERILEGIGNAATYAGQGAQNAAISMSVLTKSLGPESALTYEKFLQLSQTARVVTDKWRQQALDAAVAVGTLTKKNDKYFTNVKGQKSVEVTAANLENTLRYKWLTGKALAELYKNYQFGETLDELAHPEKAVDSFGKTAYLTGQRALTFVDALNAIKESVSSGWMNTFRLIFGDVTEAAEHFTNIADRVIGSIEKIKSFLNGDDEQRGILQYWADTGGRKNLITLLLGDYGNEVETGAIGFLDLLDGIGHTISDGIKNFIRLFMDPAQRMNMDEDPEYFRKFIAGWLLFVSNEIERFMKGIKDFFNEEIEVQGGTKTRLELIYDIVSGIGAVLKFGYDILAGVIEFVTLIGAQLQPSFDSILEFLGKLGASIYDTEQGASDAGTVRKFFQDLAETLKPVTEGINKIVEAITKFLTVLFGLDKETDGTEQKANRVGDLLLAIADIISKVLGPVLTFLASIINLISELISGNIDFKELGKKLSESFKEMLTSFIDNLPESFQGVGNWIKDLFGLWEDESQANEKSFATFLHRLFTGSFSNFGEFLGSLFEGFSLKRALENGFGFVSAFNYLNTIIGWFKGTNLYNVILAFLGVATVGTILALAMKALRVTKIIGIFFEDVGGNIKKFGTGFKQGLLGDYEWFGERMLNIAKAIAAMAAVVFIFGSMDTGRMIQGIVGLVAVMAAIFGFYYFMTNSDLVKAGWTKQMAIEAIIVTMAGAMVAIALALSVLSLAIYPLASDWRKMLTGVLGLAAMLSIFGAFIVIMVKQIKTLTWGLNEKDKWNHIAQMAVMLLVLCGAIAILSAAIGALAVALTPLAMTGWGGMIRSIIAFTAIMAVFGVFIVIMIKQLDELAFVIGGTNSWSGIGKMAAMMLLLAVTVGLMAVSIGALVVAITPLAVMSWGGFVRAVTGLAIILVELGAMIKFIQGMSVGDKTVSIKIAGLAGFALAMGILIFSLTPLAMMNFQGWAQAMSGLGIILIELAAMIMFVQKMSTGDKTLTMKIAGLAGFAAAMGILIFALTPLALMSWEGFWRGMIGLGIILTEMVIYMKLVKSMHLKNVELAGFIGFAVSIAILLFALKPLSEMSPEGYQRALIGLGTVLLEIVVLMAIINELKPDLKTAGSTLLLLIGLGASMILFGIAFNEVKDVPWERMLGFAAAISLLLVAFAGAAALAKIAGFSGMLVLVVGIGLLIAAISLLAPLVAGSLSSSLQMMAGSLNYMTSMLDSFNTTMSGMDDGAADKGINIIDKLKTMFERLVGFGRYTESINAFSTALFDLSTGLEIFQNHTGKILDPSNNMGLKMINDLAAAAPNINTLANAETGKLTSTLTALGGAMKLYAQGAEEVTGLEAGETPDVTAAIGLLRSISEGLVQEGGFVIPTTMPSEEDIGIFSAQLVALAGAMVEFEKAGQGIGDGTEDALGVLDFFVKVKERLTRSEFISDLGAAIRTFATGENIVSVDEMTEFGKNIEQLGSALNQFAQYTTYTDEQTGEIKPVNYDKAIEALESFEAMDQRLSKIKIGGLTSWFSGNPTTLVDLGGQIQTLGDNLNKFSASIIGDDEHPGFDTTVTGVALEAASSMVDFMEQMHKQLPKIGGLVGIWETLWHGRDFDFSDLNTQMGYLATGLGALGTNLNNGTWNNTEGVTNAFNTMDSIFALMIRIQSFYKQMQESGIEGWTADSAFRGLAEFVDKFANDESQVISNMSEFMRTLDNDISTWEKYNDDDYEKVLTRMEAFKSFAEGFSYMTSTIDSDRKAGTSWGFLGTKLTTDVATTITGGIETVTDAVIRMVQSMFKAADPVEGVVWGDIGKNMVDGIALGIDHEGPVTLWPSVKTMMLKAYEEGKDAIDSDSPSKLFMQLGAFMGEGTAIGIKKTTGEVGENAAEMGEVALDSAKDMIGLISRIMAEGTDATPTIAPILDMTNIDAGMAAFRDSLNGYGINLDTAYSAGRAAQIGTSGYEDTEALKPDYSGIYRKMEELGVQMQQMGREIRNMKLVLDTGAVAGGVADILDEEFGRRTFYESRS